MTATISIEVQERGGWRRLPNGPFPITAEQLHEARRLFAAELADSPQLSGAKMAPQTTARAVLERVAPQLSNFDVMMLGFAVSIKRIRILET